ncbi:SCO family protein [Vulcaniibacterium thermophilum]|uniref:SCO family protein n=1 Tax=Vulcaniibacterium thermophilum TaxID=1169913 RepID=A0A919DDW4_9GAMM|nr:SCO family protein [Vulcaniibacterium thermophilum]GHE34245.1 SCO family protein [Vulcaniibacterium thermophilum]
MKTLLRPLPLLLAAFASVAVAAPPRKAAAPLPSDSVYQLTLPLTDQDGRRADWRTRRGKPQLVSMFYTSCQYICPLIVDSAQAIDRNLTPAQKQRLGVLLISMDPGRDTPAALKAVAARRRLDTARWTLASPPPTEVRAVAGVLGIRYRPLADGEFNHTSALVLLDADGRVLARTERMGARPDPDFIAAVRRATTP